MFTFYQITTKIGSVYGVSFPAAVNAFLETISNWISLGIIGITTTPLECIGLWGYLPRLLFWMAVPPCLVLAVVVIAEVSSRVSGSKTVETAKSQSVASKLSRF